MKMTLQELMQEGRRRYWLRVAKHAGHDPKGAVVFAGKGQYWVFGSPDREVILKALQLEP